MGLPDYQSLMLLVLQQAANGEVRITEVIDRLADDLGLTAEEREELLPSGRQSIFSNRTHWAKTYLAKAGLVEATRRAHFRITDRGRDVLARKPAKIDNAFLEQFPEFVDFRTRSAQNNRSEGGRPLASEPSARTPDEVMRAAHQQIDAALKQDLLDRIIAAPPEFFEQLIVTLLVAMGYGGTAASPGQVLGRSGDGGVDGVIDQDALGLDRVYVQAKRYQQGNTLGASAIRDFFGSLDRFKAAKGLLVTTSDFSKEAQETANFLSKRIVLINGDRLTALMIRYNVGCRLEETLYLKKIDEDFFLE